MNKVLSHTQYRRIIISENYRRVKSLTVD